MSQHLSYPSIVLDLIGLYDAVPRRPQTRRRHGYEAPRRHRLPERRRLSPSARFGAGRRPAASRLPLAIVLRRPLIRLLCSTSLTKRQQKNYFSMILPWTCGYIEQHNAGAQ